MTVTADPAECSFQFKATGTEKFTTGCDIIKAALVGLSVNYEQRSRAAPDQVASVKIGEQTIAGDSPDAAKAIAAAMKAHGYPAGADPNDINYAMTVILLRDPGRLRHHGVRADRRLAGGDVPDPHPL